MSTTTDIARFIRETSESSVPSVDLDAVDQSCFDLLGVLVAGSGQPHGRMITEHVRERGGAAEASVIGLNFKTSATEAALANATMAHALDFDDMGAYGHPTAPIIPALLALGESYGRVRGIDLAVAYAIGFEVGACLAAGYDQYDRGFHSTPLFGVLAATAAGARLLDLTLEQTAAALGIAASEACGIGRNNGTMTKPLHAGLAASNAVEAVTLATAGFTAATDALEQSRGFLDAVCGLRAHDLATAVANMGNPFKVASSIIIKKYPCCGGNHSALDGVLKLVQGHDLTSDDVVSVEVGAMPPTSPVLRYPTPETGLNGKFSIQYAVGTAIRQGAVTIDDFTDERVKSVESAQAMSKVDVEVMPRWDARLRRGREEAQERDAPPRDANPVRIVLKDGRELSASVGRRQLRGAPDCPLTEAELVAKFVDNVRRSGLAEERVQRAAATWRHITEVEDVRMALRLLEDD